MIIRQFLAWTQHSSAGRRAEAASALARAYLHGNLGPEAAWEAKTAILALLDDPSPLVRRALAEACAGSERTPRPVAVALASDQPEIACLILSRSPILTDADLVDAAAMGCEGARAAIAGRHHLSYAVAGALAEIAGPETLALLAANTTAQITTGRLLRMVERHGADATLREALLARPGLPLEVRHAVAAGLARSLTGFVTGCGWLSAERGERLSREANERAVLDICADAGPGAVARVVRHLRATGQLNAGLILRAVLSGAMGFAETAMADLAGLEAARAGDLMREARGFSALHRRAGLPEILLPAFAAALDAWRESTTGASTLAGAALSRRMIERALTACETMPYAEAQGIMALLTRYEVEAAREEARDFTRAMAGKAAAEEAARAEAAMPEPVPEALPQHAAAARLELPEAEAPAAAPAVPETVAEEPAPEAATASLDLAELDAILDMLPDALLDSFHAERMRALEAAAAAGIAIAPAPAPEPVPEAAALDTIPEALVASYRPERLRLAA
ncbi:DUF2336 domain-containing protein [Methylobacterium sp. sgz302541]|uniref:DUF2336 domain-containing protein n=1 Tax=unclassified Methylobacterium TaxID=2615210 RepID=UPI003D34A44F